MEEVALDSISISSKSHVTKEGQEHKNCLLYKTTECQTKNTQHKIHL